MLFAITDIETTGSHASGNSIIEIGVCVHDGEKVVREYHTLLDPGVLLPHFITSLTHITDDMLEGAPTFDQIADDLEEVLEGTIFVAHNVSFDHSFIRAEFNAIGRQWNPRRLCTVRLARKAFPGMPSYGLGNVCNWLGLTNEAAHRALGDARAAKDLFEKCIAILDPDEVSKMISKASGDVFLPANVDKNDFLALPEKAGVYYFLNEKGKPIYIGKAKNLKKRVRQHFSVEPEGKRMQAFMKEIHHISFDLTGTELIALLLEDREIRKHWPAYNRAQKNRVQKVHVVRYEDQKGYTRLAMQNSNKLIASHKSFSSTYTARAWLMEMAQEFALDMRLLGLDMFDIHAEIPTAEVHNNQLELALTELKKREPSFVLQANGRTDDEYSFILVRNGVLKGYSFLCSDNIDVDMIESSLEYLPPTETNASIISNLSERHVGLKRIDETVVSD